MIGSILTTSTEILTDAFLSGEKVGFICAWVSILLVLLKITFEVCTVLMLKIVQLELDLIVHTEPVAQSKNPLNRNAKNFELEKDKAMINEIVKKQIAEISEKNETKLIDTRQLCLT